MPTLLLQHDVQTRALPTPRSMAVAAMFGLRLDGVDMHTIVPPIELDLRAGEVVLVTGVSGGGKSTLLRLIAEALPGAICHEDLPALPEAALVDALACPEDESPGSAAELNDVCRWLSLAGLNDAAVMLRRPSELSEGQRHRLLLARLIAVAERRAGAQKVLLIDEFGSMLDRVTAYAQARSIRRWVSGSGVCVVCATAHDDLLEPLMPQVLVEVGPGGVCQVHRNQR